MELNKQDIEFLLRCLAIVWRRGAVKDEATAKYVLSVTEKLKAISGN